MALQASFVASRVRVRASCVVEDEAGLQSMAGDVLQGESNRLGHKVTNDTFNMETVFLMRLATCAQPGYSTFNAVLMHEKHERRWLYARCPLP